MDEKAIRELIMQKQSNDHISCKAACDIADETGSPRSLIGQLLDEMKIKISACQLGCFK
jgi:hypothetical protein